MSQAPDDRLTRLEERLRQLEDQQEIADLIGAYGPLVDGGDADGVAALWTDDGIYDVDELTMTGRDEIRAMVHSAGHQSWITGGCAHFLGPVKSVVDGDTAVAVCHSLMVVNDGAAFDPAAGPRFVVRRATAHHFELTRTTEGWRVARRTSRVLDGRPESRDLLVSGAHGRNAPGRRDN